MLSFKAPLIDFLVVYSYNRGTINEEEVKGMRLGETIYKLRTEKNLSQGDLAEMLDVSRQSISKWENNSAVPDLEKIIKLSEIFKV